MLGYRDSGMPDSEANNDPRCFAKADFDEAVGRLVAVIRRERPQVIITYGDEQARLSASRPPAGARHLASGVRARRRPRVVSRGGRAVAAAEALLHDLVAGPHGSGAQQDARARPRVALRRQVVRAAVATTIASRPASTSSQWLSVRRDALLAHATQIDPTSPFWFGLSDDVLAELYPWEDWVLARSLVGTPPEGELEHDLFAGSPHRGPRRVPHRPEATLA